MDAEEIKSIMRQFKHGAADSEWKQFIKSIKITNIHGWAGQAAFQLHTGHFANFSA